MKKLYILFISLLSVCLTSCDMLDLSPLDKISGDILFSDPEGVKLYMADLYSQLPIEDYNFSPEFGYNKPGNDNGVNGCIMPQYTDEATQPQLDKLINNGYYQWWGEAYQLNRDINMLIQEIPALKITEDERKELIAESSFLRAYLYFGLVKRYGGVPIIKEVQEYSSDFESLKVPRSTERETWDFALEECDKAIEHFDKWNNGRRAAKGAALALKSRIALHAASVAKYWDREGAALSGEAVDLKLVGGFSPTDADDYYKICIAACEELIHSNQYSLYSPNPSSPEEAAANYQALFENSDGALNEVIFRKGFPMTGKGKGHNWDIWFNPYQTGQGFPQCGRMNPTLELVDSYELYDRPGEMIPINTREDGNTSDYNGFNKNVDYLYFPSADKIFEGRDARLYASIILPNTLWQYTRITIQGGIIKPDGTAVLESAGQHTLDGKTYYTFGAQSQQNYSGFNTSGNFTRSGFIVKKFLQEKEKVTPSLWMCTNDWIDMRYAEVLLNYAEAAIECSTTGNETMVNAQKAFNAIRRRAGHTTEVPLTVERVVRERRVELAFENKRHWDLVRRREYHDIFNGSKRKALVPIQDLRTNPVSYIFVRKDVRNENNKTFNKKQYYRSIPGINTTGLIQNPEY